MTPWAAQSGHLPLAARRAAADTPGCAGGACINFTAVSCAGGCEAANTTWAPQRQGFFVCPGPSQSQRPSTQTGRPQRDRRPPVRLDL
jgi:hypothetical protein